MQLKEYLETKGIKKSHFADLIGVSEQTMHSIINGKNTYVDVGYRIHVATKGVVTCEDLAMNYLKKKAARKDMAEAMIRIELDCQEKAARERSSDINNHGKKKKGHEKN